MIELQRHIEILLLTNDCVIVPGLGGFMTHYVEARFDDTDNTFIPPLRTLGFNQNLTMNDSLLVQSYIECYDVSYPEALRRIEGEVDELRQHLQTEGSYELNDIGVLSLNVEGNLEFRPCEAGILTPGLYGLSTFEMLPLAGARSDANAGYDPEPVRDADTRSDDVRDDGAQDAEPLVGGDRDEATLDGDVRDDEAPTGDTIADDTADAPHDDDRAIVIKLSWLRHAVAVAAAIAAFFMIGTPVSNSHLDGGMQQSSFIPIAASATSDDNETLAEATIGDATAGSDAVTAGSNTPANDTEGVDTQSVTNTDAAPVEDFCIVLASQVSQKNADNFMQLLTEKGFKEAYILEGKFRRVVYGHYASKDDAVEQLRNLRKESRKLFGEGWVMRVGS